MDLMKAMLNKEEYKGLIKLFLQRSNYAVAVCAPLAFVLVLAALVLFAGADAASAKFFISGHTGPLNTDSGTKLKSTAQSSDINPVTVNPGAFTISYFKAPSASKPIEVVITDTQYATFGASDSSLQTVAAIYGDTLKIISGPEAVNDAVLVNGDRLYDTVYLTNDTAGTSDILTYVFSITNHANASDSIGLIVDTAWIVGSTSETTGRFSYQFFNARGDTLTNILTSVQAETGMIGLAANEAGTASIRIYTTGTVNADTIRIAVRAMANFGTGRVPGAKQEVFAYSGFNGVEYGGDGNAAAYIELSITGALIRMALTDTVFTPMAYAGGAADTQNYLPGSLMVHTLWFDNDGNDTSDTIVVDYFIDTRYLKFDSAGLTALRTTTQVAAAETFVGGNYGNIFIDSGMPSWSSSGFNVAIEYSRGSSTMEGAITAATNPEVVGRIRWTISRTSQGVVGMSNGDSLLDIDTAPTAPKAGTDVDMGYVRFSVVIR